MPEPTDPEKQTEGIEDSPLAQQDIDALLAEASSLAGETASVTSEATSAPAAAAIEPAVDPQTPPVDMSSAGPLPLPDFATDSGEVVVQPIDLLRDVGLHVKIELGRCRMLVEDVLRLSEGSIVELDKLAGDPVDIYANDRLVARGEVLVLNDSFCVRVNEIFSEVSQAFQVT
jgi:flagellar motor switch protein FliN/FliY